MTVINTIKPNTFWIAANVLFDLGTGKKSEVLMLVNKVEDATLFTEHDAQNYLNFVSTRASNIQWTIESLQPQNVLRMRALGEFPRQYVIKGVQYA